jgi:hypothetical protein
VSDATGSDRSGLRTTYRVLAVASVVVVLVMAALAGHSNRLFGSGDIEVHGFLGELLFAAAVVMVVLAWLTHVRGVVLGLAVAFAVLCFAQVGLGFVGRDTIEAAAWHIPNGVLIMGVGVAHAVLVFDDRPR